MARLAVLNKLNLCFQVNYLVPRTRLGQKPLLAFFPTPAQSFICLFDWRKDRDRKASSIHWFTP